MAVFGIFCIAFMVLCIFWGASGATNLQFNNPLRDMVWWKRPIYVLVTCGPFAIPGALVYFLIVRPFRWVPDTIEDFFDWFNTWARK